MITYIAATARRGHTLQWLLYRLENRSANFCLPNSLNHEK